MIIKILSFGKVKNKNLLNEINKFYKQISLKVDFIELKEVKDKNIKLLKRKEFELIRSFIDKFNKDVKKILLWEKGSILNSFEFKNLLYDSNKDIVFIITGPYGPSDSLIKYSDLVLSLSKLTFTHEIALLLLIEQIYRAESIHKNKPYHK